MGNFFLPKGTEVRHGTSLCRVRAILENGLKPGADRQEKRIENEHKPEIDGVYVGTLLAYFGAYAAYSAELSPLWITPDYFKAATFFQNPQHLRTLDLAPAPINIPVVLRIRLAEDCLLYADEDCVLDGSFPINQRVPTELLASEAKRVWETWQTGCIVRESGIPPEWIETIEYPRLGALESSLSLHKDTWADCELFIAGIMQASLKKQPRPLIAPYRKRYGRDCLSQQVPATEAGLAHIENLKGLSGNSNLYFNHLHLNQVIEHMAEKYGIPLHRAKYPQ